MKGRKIWLGAVLVGVFFALQPVESPGQTTADLMRKLENLRAYPDLIVVNAKISTMDGKLSEFQAMAVKNSRILALGANDEIRFLAGPKTEVVDAKGRRALPGLIDGHTHPQMWAVMHYAESEGDFAAKKYNDPQLQISHVTGKEPLELVKNVERVVVQRTKAMGPGKWVWIHMFGGNTLAESKELAWPLIAQAPIPGVPTRPAPITREFLDAIAPDNPVIVQASDILGPSVHNTKAKEEMLKLLGGEVGNVGSWNPLFWDVLMHGHSIEDKMDFLKRELLSCLVAQGITTFANHYYGAPSIMKIYRALYERGEMPVRWGWWIGGSRRWASGNYAEELGYPSPMYDLKKDDALRRAAPDLGDFRGVGNDYIWNAGIAFELFDNALNCTKAKKIDPKAPLSPIAGYYLPDCGDAPKDYDKIPGADSYQQAKAALEAGLRVGFLHALSDGDLDALFHMLEEAIANGKITLEQVRALRITATHNPFIRPDQVEKIAQYGVRAEFSSWQALGLEGPDFIKLHGEQYLNWILPMKSLLDAGTHPIFTTDAHVHKEPPEFQPIDEQGDSIWANLEFFLTRIPNDKVLPKTRREAVDRVSLMKSATIWAAEGLLNEKNIGSLEVGKLADFIVLDKDYFTIPEDQVHTINTVLTAVGGKVWFKADNF